MTDDIRRHLERYRERCAINGRAHYLAGDRYSFWARMFGVPVVILTAVVGTAIFGSLGTNPEIGWRILAGCVSVTATVLSSLQTYLNFGALTEKHRAAGARYASLRREFEVALLELNMAKPGEEDHMLERVKRLKASLDEAAAISLAIPDKQWEIASREIKQKNTEEPSVPHANE